ncbi:hypothetical protein MCAV_06830 [[Mycoplasma] cavipharyngis]|uniref:hypothetical protein n=1 Tax=[Mycoplasma] cavipharyngis TaxID=92757 RepID=UPI0037041D2D
MIIDKYNKSSKKFNIFFANYQSIGIIIDLVKKYNIIFDIAVTEEIRSYLNKYLNDYDMSNDFLNLLKNDLIWLENDILVILLPKMNHKIKLSNFN